MTTGQENNQAQGEQVENQTNPAPETAAQAPNTESHQPPAQDEGQDPPQQTPPDLDEAKVIEWLNAKNPEAKFETIGQLFTQPEKVEVEKIVNPWEGVIDQEDEQYLTYKKETGRGRKDFEALNQDLESVSILDMARDRVSKEVGRPVSQKEADAYLEDTLGVDLSDIEEMSAAHVLKLEVFQRPHRQERIVEKEKYRQPIQKPEPQQGAFDAEKFVQVGDGLFVDKTIAQRNQELDRIHNEQARAAVNSVTADKFKIEFDNNGVKTPIEVDYDFQTDSDRHSMGSKVGKYSNIMDERYRTENGFKHAEFQKDFEWADPAFRAKAIPALMNKAVAQFLETLSKSDNNVNFTRNQMPSNQAQASVGPIYRTGSAQQGFPKANI